MDRPDNPLGRYARILEALAVSPEGMTLTQLAGAVDLQVAAVHRLTNSLCTVGFAMRHKNQKTYVLGPRMVRLCHLAFTPPSFVAMAKPILRELAIRHGETAYLAKLRGTDVESIAMEVPQGGDKAYVQPGRTMPLHAAASAKAIFAFQDPELVNKVLAEPPTKFTPDTKIEDGDIRAELEQVRAEKFAICDNELDQGVLSYATPILQERSLVIYSVGINGLSESFRLQKREDVRDSLLNASRTLSKILKNAFDGKDSSQNSESEKLA